MKGVILKKDAIRSMDYSDYENYFFNISCNIFYQLELLL